MKFIAKVSFASLWRVFLVTSLCIVTFSAVASALQIGEKYGGGKIVYIDATGNHGLIAAKADLPGTYYNWDAAKEACDNFVADCSSDWYLPSKEELNKLYLTKGSVGGFVYGSYWSSTPRSADIAWYQHFGSGTQGGNYKTYELRVRPVRVF
ncbi:MAG: DUF1566 domain-containing protein [Chlorobium sp.]|nr:MAG: DUF1566 domain-containing protein [Chlorobium sp.]